MIRTVLVAGAFACLSFGVHAQECEFPYDATVGEFLAAGAPLVEILPEDLPNIVDQVEALEGKDLGDVTRGFFVNAGSNILLGLEVDNCLLPPILVGTVTPSSAPLSGKDAQGNIGA